MSKDNGIEELVIRKVNTLEIFSASFVRYQSFFCYSICASLGCDFI